MGDSKTDEVIVEVKLERDAVVTMFENAIQTFPVDVKQLNDGDLLVVRCEGEPTYAFVRNVTKTIQDAIKQYAGTCVAVLVCPKEFDIEHIDHETAKRLLEDLVRKGNPSEKFCSCPELASAQADGKHIGCGLPMAPVYEIYCCNDGCGAVVDYLDADLVAIEADLPKPPESCPDGRDHSYMKRPKV